MSQLVLILRGLPLSGKSTFAREWVAAKPAERSRVNRDDIRFANFGAYEIEPKLEKTVTQIEHVSLRALLQAGRSVVIDNQNLRAEPVQDYLAIAADYGATVLFRDFSVEPREALRRNAQRAVNQLPEQVLKDLYARFFRTGGFPPQPTLRDEADRYVPDVSLPTAYIFDLDGTLALFGTHRGPFEYAKLLDDEPNANIVALAKLIKAAGHRLVVISGRENTGQVESDTTLWLAASELAADAIFLRGAADARSDAVVKREIFDREIRARYNVLGVVDDRLQVVRMWHRLGLTVLRVGNPDAIY